MTSTYETLREHVFGLTLIDTHEHLPRFEADRPQDTDVLEEYLRHYFSSDLVSAGLSDEGLAFARDHTRPLMKRWETVEPFWEASRNTGYARALDIAVRELYGIDAITRDTLEALNEAFAAARTAGGHYDTVLREKSRVRIAIEDAGSSCVAGDSDWVDTEYFRPVFRCDAFIAPAGRAELEALTKETGVPVHTLDDLKAACETYVETHLERGAVGLKCGLAYFRTLKFETTSADAASDDFAKLLEGADPWSLPRLQDHMMHHVCALADARALPFQIHTGLQEGNGNFIYHADPALLANLFMEYPHVKFDVFHIGYPYQQTLSALAKNFRNVFIDFAWVHIMSPEAAVRALVEYLDAVPANKIFGFGGDYAFIDGVAGHAFIARENVAAALAEKVDAGVFSLDRAGELARMILHDNPAALFGLQGRPDASPCARD